MNSLTIAAVVVTCVAFVVASSAPSCSQNSIESTYFADDDCSKYWECSDGVAYQKDCPQNLVFNPKTNDCDWPQSAGCTGLGWNPNPASVQCSTSTSTSTTVSVSSVTNCQGRQLTD